VIEAWTIYRFDESSPFIVKKHYGYGKNVVFTVAALAVAETLQEAREALPQGRELICFRSTKHDDPVVIETWMPSASVTAIRLLTSTRRVSR
jgi:hypothetical protein